MRTSLLNPCFYILILKIVHKRQTYAATTTKGSVEQERFLFAKKMYNWQMKLQHNDDNFEGLFGPAAMRLLYVWNMVSPHTFHKGRFETEVGGIYLPAFFRQHMPNNGFDAKDSDANETQVPSNTQLCSCVINSVYDPREL